MAPPNDEQPVRRRRGSSPSTSSASLVDTVKSVEKKSESSLLLVWDDLDEWRRDNAFIVSGYRPTSNSYQGSFSSIFTLHNESVNIWTHLAGSILFTSLGAAAFYFYEKLVAPRYSSATWTDMSVFGCFFAGAFLCLGMSATFHTLCNHSPEVARWGNKLDYTGIVCLILGSYMPALYYGFYCLPELMEIYLSTVSVSYTHSDTHLKRSHDLRLLTPKADTVSDLDPGAGLLDRLVV